MAVIDIFLESVEKNKGKENQTERTLTWLVQTDSIDTDPDEIEEVFGISDGDEYGGDTEMHATRFVSKRDEKDRMYWHYSITFSTDASDSENPLDQPHEVEWEDETEQEEYRFDAQLDIPVVNTLSRPFSQQALRDKSKAVIRVRKNRPTDDSLLASYVANRVNEDWFGWMAPGTVKTSYPRRKRRIGNINGSRRIYWEDEMVFIYDEDGWADHLLNEDTMYFDDFGELVNFKDDNLGQTKGTGLLDTDGNKLPEGEDAIYLEFNKYETLDFSIFGVEGVIFGSEL